MVEARQGAEMEAKTRVRGPALESLADVRRQAKRLYTEYVYESEAKALTSDRLRIAITLLGLIKSTILEEQERTQPDPNLKDQIRRLTRQLSQFMGPSESGSSFTGVAKGDELEATAEDSDPLESEELSVESNAAHFEEVREHQR